jgi:hypothetical protein
MAALIQPLAQTTGGERRRISPRYATIREAEPFGLRFQPLFEGLMFQRNALSCP